MALIITFESKLRLIVTSGRKVLTTIGPDFGSVTGPEQGLIFASEDLLANEILSYAWLPWNREFETSFLARVTKGNMSRFGSFINKHIVGRFWSNNSDGKIPDFKVFRPGHIYDHPAIINFMKRKGGKPEKLHWKQVNGTSDPSIPEYLERLMTV